MPSASRASQSIEEQEAGVQRIQRRQNQRKASEPQLRSPRIVSCVELYVLAFPIQSIRLFRGFADFRSYALYVERSPSTGDKVRISTQGGSRPQWRRDGKEL